MSPEVSACGSPGLPVPCRVSDINAALIYVAFDAGRLGMAMDESDPADGDNGDSVTI